MSHCYCYKWVISIQYSGRKGEKIENYYFKKKLSSKTLILIIFRFNFVYF